MAFNGYFNILNPRYEISSSKKIKYMIMRVLGVRVKNLVPSPLLPLISWVTSGK